MRWRTYVGDILDVPADVLVCSANVYLNLSGGVGGAFLLRYGPAMQDELRAYLSQRGRAFVDPGTVVVTPPCGSPYVAVLHAVAVEATYTTSRELVCKAVNESLANAAALGARHAALAAVGTGYGRLTIGEFAEAIRPLAGRSFRPLELVTIAIETPDKAAEMAAAMQAWAVT